MGKIIIESERLILREMGHEDYSLLAPILQDIDVMYAWEHAFSDQEVKDWIDRRIKGYETYGYSYWLAIDKVNGEVVGQIGLLYEEINGEEVLGIGWILAKNAWGVGYATEGAGACIEYAAETLGKHEITADIRPTNTSSIAVAKRLGMINVGEYSKHCYGKDMPHYIFKIQI